MSTVIAEMRAGFNALNVRVTELKDDTREDAQQMHRENKDRLVRIEDQCRITNGRVSTLESEVRSVWQRIKEIARRRPDGDDDTEADHLTLGDLKWYLVCLGAGFGAAMGLLQLMGKL
jgi:predicted methyltransferase